MIKSFRLSEGRASERVCLARDALVGDNFAWERRRGKREKRKRTVKKMLAIVRRG